MIKNLQKQSFRLQSKTLFLANFDPYSSTVKSVFDCHLPGVRIQCFFRAMMADNINTSAGSFMSYFEVHTQLCFRSLSILGFLRLDKTNDC